MREVIISKPRNETLTAQLVSLYEAFKGAKRGEDLKFNLRNLNWAYPLLTLPLSAYMHATQSTHEIEDGTPAASYLQTIHFPEGISSATSLERFFRYKKNYIPIGVLQREKMVERDRLESLFAQLIFETLKAAQGTFSAIHYPISELMGNIFDHSKRDEGFIMGQFYPTKNYLDICIADCGRGLSAAYFEEKGLRFTDEEAIAEAMKGHSTKIDKDRGYGIRTSKRMVCEGLNGGFVFVSGSAALISFQKEERLVSLPAFYWQGVIIAYRIPSPKTAIDYTLYVE